MIDLDPQPAPPPAPHPPPASDAGGSGDDLVRHAAPLAGVLVRLRRRAARLVWTREALRGLAAAGGLLLLAALLLVAKQPWARPAGWLAAAVALVGYVLHGFWRARASARDELAAARALGHVAPSEASDLLSAVELARAAPDDPRTAALVRLHLARMGKIAAAIDPHKALGLRPVGWALLALLGVVAVHGALVRFGGTRVRDAYAYLAFDAAAQAAPLFAPEPIAGDIALTYRYPVHMNRPPRTVAGTAGDISAPKGTVVEIGARADRDVETAYAVVGALSVPLRVKGRELAGEMLLTAPGEWRLRYAKASGATVAEGPPRPVAIEPDAFPEVKLSSPAAELEIDGREVLTLAFSASDDYGLAGLSLAYSIGRGTPEQRREIVAMKDLPRRHRGESSWDLAPLGLRPGDRVTYYLEATDNDTVSGPKKGVSATQVLKVFSETEHHREILKKAEEQWERLVTGLGDRLDEPPAGDNGEAALPPWAAATGDKDQALASIANDMRRLSHELSRDKRAPPEIGRALGHVGSRVGAANQRTSASRASLVRRPAAPAARTFRQALGGEIDEEEKGVLYLEDLIDRRKLLDLQEMARELQQGRQELARLIEQFKKAPDEAMRRQILSEVARLKERLHELFKRMEGLTEEISDQHLNEEAQNTMSEGRDMMSELDEIQRQLSAGDADKALEALERLQKSLEKMEKKFGEHAGEVDEDAKRVGRELKQLASDLMDVSAEQEALRQKTESLRQRERAQQKEKLEKLGKEFLEKQRERVAKARAELGGVDQKLAESLAEDEELQAALDRLGQLDQALEGNDFDEALEQSSRALRHGQDLRMRLDAEREVARRFPGAGREPEDLEEAGGHVERAERPMREVTEDLEKLLRSTRAEPNEAEKQAMKELAQKQGALQKQTEGLQQKLEELGKQMPVFGPKQGELLGEATGQMGQAKGKLAQSDPRGASARQGDALQRLQQMLEAMKQGEGQGEGESPGGSEPGIPMPFGESGGPGGEEGDGEFEDRKVEIPAADQSRAPAEFRKDILDAMKDEAPDKYRESVRDYYEELVK